MLVRNAGFDMLEQLRFKCTFTRCQANGGNNLNNSSRGTNLGQHFDDSTFRRWHYTGQLIHRKLAKRFLGLLFMGFPWQQS